MVGEAPKLEENGQVIILSPEPLSVIVYPWLVFPICGKQGMGERQGLTVLSLTVLYLDQAQGYPNPYF